MSSQISAKRTQKQEAGKSLARKSNGEKSMSVEKLDSAIIRQEKLHFTTHLNSVLQHLNDAAALGLWCYLTSLPEGWVINKKHLMNHFNIGRDKVTGLLTTLKNNNLIYYCQPRNSDGTLGEFSILVKAGYEFSTGILKNRSPVQPVTGESAPIKETINKKERTTINCSTKAERDKYFDDFWKVTPRKENKKQCHKIWVRDNLDQKAELIIEDVKKRLAKHDRWSNKAFIPMPSTYLNNEGWNDEIIEAVKAKDAPSRNDKPEAYSAVNKMKFHDELKQEAINDGAQTQVGGGCSEGARTGNEGVRSFKDLLF